MCSPAYICDISEAGSAEGRTMGRQWLTLHNTLCSRWKDNLLPKKINKFQVQTNTKRQLDGNFHEKTLLRAAQIIQMEMNLKTLKKLVSNWGDDTRGQLSKVQCLYSGKSTIKITFCSTFICLVHFYYVSAGKRR